MKKENKTLVTKNGLQSRTFSVISNLFYMPTILDWKYIFLLKYAKKLKLIQFNLQQKPDDENNTPESESKYIFGVEWTYIVNNLYGL